MESERTVTTNATNCTFGTFFGAGYGGTSYSRYAPSNKNDVKYNVNWNDWITSEYKQNYNSTYQGVSTQINYLQSSRWQKPITLPPTLLVVP